MKAKLKYTMRKLKNEELPRLDIEAFKEAAKTPLIIILDDVRSLNNIGSVFRTADAFLIEKIYLCGITASPPHKDIRKTALGATESVLWEYRESVMEVVKELKERGDFIVAVEQVEGSQMLNDFNVKREAKYVLIFGNEVKGVAQDVVDICDTVVEIPQYGTKHSLNISVSVGVVVWDIVAKLKK